VWRVRHDTGDEDLVVMKRHLGGKTEPIGYARAAGKHFERSGAHLAPSFTLDDGRTSLRTFPHDRELRGLERLSMEMVFVVDCSGSMSGQPLEQAKAAVLAGLNHLEPGDTFQVIRFSDRASRFGFARLQTATAYRPVFWCRFSSS